MTYMTVMSKGQKQERGIHCDLKPTAKDTR